MLDRVEAELEGIRSASLCSALCLRLLRELLHWTGKPVSAEQVELLRECASTCEQALERIVHRRLHNPEALARVCARCANACDNNPALQLVSSSCRRAAAAFRAMARIPA